MNLNNNFNICFCLFFLLLLLSPILFAHFQFEFKYEMIANRACHSAVLNIFYSFIIYFQQYRSEQVVFSLDFLQHKKTYAPNAHVECNKDEL